VKGHKWCLPGVTKRHLSGHRRDVLGVFHYGKRLPVEQYTALCSEEQLAEDLDVLNLKQRGFRSSTFI